MKRIFGIFAFICFFLAKTLAQTGTAVTDISVLITNMSVQITWKRAQGYSYSPDINYRIYRDTKPLTKQTINSNTLIAEQDSSQLIFSEILPDMANYYYAVMAVKDDNFLATEVLPGVNATHQPIKGQYPLWEEVEKANISNFNVIAQSNSVIITYTTENKGNKLNLYRSTAPFSSIDSLAAAMLVSSFTDTGSPLVDVPPVNEYFYYALIDDSSVSDGTARFVRGITTSLAPVCIMRSNQQLKTTAQTARVAPLPIDSSIESNSYTSSIILPDIEIKEQTEKQAKEAYIFPTETPGYLGGTTEISLIIKDCFLTQNWPKAETELNRYIYNTNSNSAKQRAEFYLAETYYFMGKKRQALLLFLSLRDAYPLESAEWIDATIAL